MYDENNIIYVKHGRPYGIGQYGDTGFLGHFPGYCSCLVPLFNVKILRGVPRILAGGFLVVVKDIAKFCKTTPTN